MPGKPSNYTVICYPSSPSYRRQHIPAHMKIKATFCMYATYFKRVCMCSCTQLCNYRSSVRSENSSLAKVSTKALARKHRCASTPESPLWQFSYVLAPIDKKRQFSHQTVDRIDFIFVSNANRFSESIA